MERGGGGVVINVSSIATEDPPPDQIRYVVAKSALVGLTRSLAVELGPRGIRVNAVVPGLVETDLSKHVSRMQRDSLTQKTPLGRLATPLDVAKAVVLLASSYSEFTSGTQFGVTGGSPPFL
jgi:3-oxoacyl-[acyl-carrier protein] reductase